MIKRVSSRTLRLRRHRRLRLRISGTAARPRVSVFRSGKHIYAQVINDETGTTLAQASSLDKEVVGIEPVLPVVAQGEHAAAGDKDAKRGKQAAKAEATPAVAPPVSKKMRQAQQVGTLLAQRALAKGIKQIVFDRGGYPYHGRIKALAESARAAGLEF